MSCPTMHAWAGTYGARSNHDRSVGAFISARVLAMKKQGASGPLGPASHMNASASPSFTLLAIKGPPLWSRDFKMNSKPPCPLPSKNDLFSCTVPTSVSLSVLPTFRDRRYPALSRFRDIRTRWCTGRKEGRGRGLLLPSPRVRRCCVAPVPGQDARAIR